MKAILIAILFLAKEVVFAGPCGSPDDPQLYSNDSTQFHYRWDTDEAALLKSSEEFDPLLNEFKAWVKTFAPVDSLELMKIQRDAYLAAGPDFAHLVARIDRVVAGHVGTLNKPFCLEAFVMSEHMKMFPPQWSYPAEMLVIVLRNRAEPSKLKIFYSFGEGKAHYVSPPYSQSMWDQIETLIASGGWRPDFFSHSHPFMIYFEEAPHVGGTVVPSDEDVSFYSEWMSRPEPQNYLRTRVVTPFQAIEFTKNDIPALIK